MNVNILAKNEIDNDVIDAIRNKFWGIDAKYVFDIEMHKISKRESNFQPRVIPILWKHVLNEKRILTYKQLAAIVKKHSRFQINSIPGYTENQVVLARCRQFWTGFLRELHVAIKLKDLDPDGSVFRDDEADTGRGGIDLIYQNSVTEETLYFAVKMPDRKNDQHSKSQTKRKESKRADFVTVLYAKKNLDNPNGLDKVPEETIRLYACLKKS